MDAEEGGRRMPLMMRHQHDVHEQHDDDDEEEPLLVKPMTCSYRTLLSLLSTLDFGRNSRNSSSSSTLGFNKKPRARYVGGGVGETATASISAVHPPPAKRRKQEAAAEATATTEAQLTAGNRNVPAIISSSSSSQQRCGSLSLLLPHELCVRVLQFLTIQRVHHDHVVVVGCSSQAADGSSGHHHPLSSCLDESDETWWLAAPGSMPRGVGAEWVQFALAPTSMSSSSPSSSSSAASSASASPPPPSATAASTSSNVAAIGGGGRKSRRLCRLSCVSMKILPLPQGPLSVLEFIVQRFCGKTQKWYNVVDDETEEGARPMPTSSPFRQLQAMFSPPSFSVANRTGWQHFQFAQDLDVDEVRIVCLRNQISPSVQQILPPTTSSNSAAPIIDNGNPFVQQLSRFESVGFIAVRFD
jgi:hypothetical protein